MNSDCIDLIYLDPPFNSNRIFSAPVGSRAAGAAFDDMWKMKDVDWELLVRMTEQHPQLVDYITSIKKSHGEAMMSYITYMAQRLFEMHRVLKDTGSIYLHCDPTAGHYLKVVMDFIFGGKNFRNEIVWKRKTNVQNRGEHQLGRNHDVILYYAKGEKSPFYKKFAPYDDAYIEKTYKHHDSRGRYATFPCTHQAGSEYKFRGITRKWRFKKSRMTQMFKDGVLSQSKPGAPFRYKKYLDDAEGVPLQTIWSDIPPASGSELTGYPTQKPRDLLYRIIELSSMPGDIVLDPFCGCATTCVAAQHLHRRWIGIDLSPKTEELIKDRLKDDVGALFNDFTPYTSLPDRRDVKRMSKRDARPILYGEQCGYCAGCKEHFKDRHLEVDHIIPKSKGGGDFFENYQLLCGNCNRIKGDRSMEYLLMVLENRKSQHSVFGIKPSSLRNL